MPEDKRVAIKLSPQLHEWLKDEQYETRKRVGREPTMTDLLERAWKAFKAKPGQAAPEGKPANPATEWHRKLSAILASGDQPTIAAVTQNIDVFHDRLRPARRAKAG